MVETVKDSQAFKCVMERRAEEMEAGPCWYLRKNVLIACYSDGTPLTPRDKHVICEMEKLALGGERCYMTCGEPEMYRPDTWSGNMQEEARIAGIKRGDMCRRVSITYDRDEAPHVLPNKLFDLLVIGTPIERGLPSRGNSESGSFCAYPGGCD